MRQKASVCVPYEPFMPKLIFVRKARAIRFSTWVGSHLTCKYWRNW